MVHSDRSNELRETVESGDVAVGLLDNTYSPSVVELCGELGLDFVWIDLEHGGPSPFDAPTLENLLRAAERAETEVLLRLPATDPGVVRKSLDAGVRSLFLPRVEGADEVRREVKASRFSYDTDVGDRGLANPRARRWGLVEDYVTSEDEEVLIGVTIETRAAVSSIDDILDVPELGFVFVGPLDLSVSYGHPGDLDHPDVTEAVETVREAALDVDVPVGGLGFDMDDVNDKVEDGYQLLNLGSTTGTLRSAVTGWLEDYDGQRDDP